MKKKDQSQGGTNDNQSQSCKVEFHSRHHKLVVRDLKTGKYVKKPNKH